MARSGETHAYVSLDAVNVFASFGIEDGVERLVARLHRCRSHKPADADSIDHLEEDEVMLDFLHKEAFQEPVLFGFECQGIPTANARGLQQTEPHDATLSLNCICPESPAQPLCFQARRVGCRPA